ncbi:MAG: branched-chain amino acid ABC transporter ATP-binding protein/permease [Actinomycetota bacterium]|nr:branched-chain amino acid ABC transporter ATP-binding protein/permease [Actinomycetota bacterium]
MSNSPKRRLALTGLVTALVAVVFPWLPFVSYSVLGSANLAAYYAMVAVSLVVLTGWVGQISLGHAGLVGVGAYVTGHVANSLHVAFPANILWAMGAGAAVAAVLGAVAVRVRGLYLAVATLVFSWTAGEFLFRQRWFTGTGTTDVAEFGRPGTFPHFDWTSRRTYFYASWAAVAAVVLLATNLRNSRTGRAFFAVRGSEVAAASLGIGVARTKVLAFAVSGALAAAAGNLLMVRDEVVTPDAFRVEVSLFFLAVAVVGGLTSLGGAVAAALLFAALNEVFFRVAAFAGWLEVVPPVLLTVVLLLYRGGLAALPDAIIKRWGTRFERARAAVQRRWTPIAVAAHRLIAELAERAWDRPTRKPKTEHSEPARGSNTRLDLEAVLGTVEPALPSTQEPLPAAVAANGNGNGKAHPAPLPTWRDLKRVAPALPPGREDRTPVVEVEHVTVRFGGLVAANDVSLTVREGEIVGLIGPNGAGKTTTFNAIAGLNVPTSGRVLVHGTDVTDWPVDARARLGVGRTFQAIQLVPQLTVFDNLLVATHVHNPTGFASNLFLGPATAAAERNARKRVRRVAALLELEPYLERRAADLPFGVLRMVELARAVVTESRLLMLDEPASGLDNTETERLTDIVRFIRDIGVTVLLIEHDVAMVTAVSDWVYVLNQGAILAEGTPTVIARDQRVVAAYLGQAEEDSLQEAPA